MCVNFTFSSLLRQRESLDCSQASPHSLPSFSSWNLQTTEGWDICQLQVWCSCSRTKGSGEPVALSSDADQGQTQYYPYLHPTPCTGAENFLPKHMATHWCQATGCMLSSLAVPLASCGAAFTGANRDLLNCMCRH